jgi:hypothetical protein
MECNIDARGRAVRFTGGLIIVLAAAVLAMLRPLGVAAGDWWWVVIGGLALFGGFGICEARAGWCAVRAMGVKTRL